jgi:hypothetical protein
LSSLHPLNEWSLQLSRGGSYFSLEQAEFHVECLEASLSRLEALPTASNAEPIDISTATAVILKAGQLVGLEGSDGESSMDIPGWRAESDLCWDEWTSWTTSQLRRAVAAIEAQEEGEYEESLWEDAIEGPRLSEVALLNAAQEARMELSLDLARRRGAALLAAPEELEKINRYEGSLERSLLRTLHELERHQERRRGGFVPPTVTFDVALDTGD